MTLRRWPQRLRLALTALLLAHLLAACDNGQTPATAHRLWQPDAGLVLQSPTQPLPLDALHGKVLLVFFGYTQCPDICPTGLATLSQVLTRLAPAEQARVRVLFVSVDPQRDTPEQIQRYLPLFHPQLLGLHVPEPALKPLAHDFRVYYTYQAIPDGSGRYAVDHSTHVALVNAQGQLTRLLPFTSSADDLLKSVRGLL